MCKLGSGVYSKIYLVEDEEGDQHAMKICLKENGYTFGMSYREADTAIRFSHPHIVCLERTIQGNPFKNVRQITSPLDENHRGMVHDVNHLLYEKAECNFSEYLNEYDLSFQALISVFSDILLGLEYMHCSGYIHRDLRPDNVLIFHETCEACEACLNASGCERPSLVAKVSDFGATRQLLHYDELSPQVNNYFYRPPECILGSKNYQCNVDIWSFGCMIYNIFQDKLLVQAESHMIDVDYLRHFARILPFDFTQEVVDKYALKKSSRSFQEFFPITVDLSEVMSEEDFQEFITGILQPDPKRRLNATQCLDLPFFNSVREKIVNTRQHFPPIQSDDDVLHVHKCTERIWAMGCFKKLYNDRQSDTVKNWYSPRIFFLAINFMDATLAYLKKDENPYIIPTENTGKILTKRNFHIVYVVCIYLAVKYFAGISSKILSFQNIYPQMHYTTEEMIYAGNFETKLFKEILGQRIYRTTFYDRLLQDRKPTTDDEGSLLVYIINGRYDGKKLNRAYKHWAANTHRYVLKSKR